jgi:hypothetical protein
MPSSSDHSGAGYTKTHHPSWRDIVEVHIKRNFAFHDFYHQSRYEMKEVAENVI